MKTKSLLLMATGALILSACGNQVEQQKPAPVGVRIMALHTNNSLGHQVYSGTIAGGNTVELSFTQAGTISTMSVRNGDYVRKGQVIAAIENTMANGNLQSAKAQLDQARDAYNRAKAMFESESIPEIEWIDAQSKLRQAEAQYQMATKGMGDTRLYAPFNGYVAARQVEMGQNVDAGNTVVKLVQIDKVKAIFSVTDSEISHFRKGQQIDVVVSSLNDRPFEGQIYEIGVEADGMTHSFEMSAIIDNAKHELLPGMVCSLKAKQEGKDHDIVIPPSVVMFNSDNTCFVWLARNGKAIRRLVTIGNEDKYGIHILEGLQEGDSLIVEGQQKVSDGTEITFK